jgi:hypothetical protein
LKKNQFGNTKSGKHVKFRTLKECKAWLLQYFLKVLRQPNELEAERNAPEISRSTASSHTNLICRVAAISEVDLSSLSQNL